MTGVSAILAMRGLRFGISAAPGVLAMTVVAPGGFAVWYRLACNEWPGQGASTRVHAEPSPMRPYGFGAGASQQGQAVSVWLAGEQDRQTDRRFMETAVGSGRDPGGSRPWPRDPRP